MPSKVFDIPPFSTILLDMIHGWSVGQLLVELHTQYGMPSDSPRQLFDVVLKLATFINKTVRGFPKGLWPHQWLCSDYDQCSDLFNAGFFDKEVNELGILEATYLLLYWPYQFHQFVTICEILAWDEKSADPCPLATQWFIINLMNLTELAMNTPWLKEAYCAYYQARAISPPSINLSKRRDIGKMIDHIRYTSIYIPILYACELLNVDKLILENMISDGLITIHPAYPNRFVRREDVDALTQQDPSV